MADPKYNENTVPYLSGLKKLAVRTDARLDSLESKTTTLIGSDTGKSVRTIANEELAAQLIPANAKEALDTLQEIAAWIQSHPDDASGYNLAIQALQGIVAGIGGDEDDYATVLAAISGEITKNAYSHPTQTANEAAFRLVGNDAQGHVVPGRAVTKDDITGLGIPAQDTTYGNVVPSTNGEGGTAGLMTPGMAEKLNGIVFATDAEVEAMLDEVYGADE